MSRKKTTAPEKPTAPDLRVVSQVSASVPPASDEPEDAEVLNALELRFVDLRASGHTYEEIATGIDKSTRTCRRWERRPEIASAIKTRSQEQVATARSVLASGMHRASRALVAMADGTSKAEAPRVSAARAVVEVTTRLVEIEEIESRLSELEARQGKQPGGAGFQRRN
jgi:hypothetical protein